jgi:gluconokinase
MTLEHGAEELARALLEGIGFRFRSVRQMLADAGLEVTQIRASGGFTRSPFWLQLMASLLDRELLVPGFGETSAFGAAFWAMFAAGRVDRLEAVARFVQTKERYRPDPVQAAHYHRLYELYRLLYRQMLLPFAEVSAFQEELAHSVDGGKVLRRQEERP